MVHRVAITGMGAVCGLGNNLNDVWSGILEGKSGISQIEQIKDLKNAVTIAGEVKNFELSEEAMPSREAKRYDRFLQFALSAGYEAFLDAGLTAEDLPYEAERIGSILGVGMGGFPEMEKSYDLLLEKGNRRVSPFFIPAVIPNMASGLLSIRLGLKGLNYTISSACASAAHALTAASHEIMLGRQDMVITGGSEGAICNTPLAGFTNMKALSRRNDEPQRASRPFDSERNGFVMGEGAGVLVLENLEKAKARGARIYAEVVGHGATSDAHHITTPHPEGEGACRCMKMALNDAGIKPEEVNYINAHGTSTPLGDKGETNAIKKTFGDHAYNLLVSSTKSMTGHLLGAAGGIETIFCAKALHHQIAPPTINLENPDPDCDLDYVALKPREAELNYVLNNSFGFGGTNSSAILKRYQG